MQLLKLVKNCAIPNKRVFLCLMLKTSLLLVFCLISGLFIACEKTAPYDGDAQLVIDDAIISKWIQDNSATFTKHSSGVYYSIGRAGTGDKLIGLEDTLYVQYEGRVLDADSAFSSTLTETDTLRVMLSAVMPGWQKVVPLIKSGGQIRMIIPSTLAYQNRPVSYGNNKYQQVPENSILDFTVNIRKIKYKVNN